MENLEAKDDMRLIKGKMSRMKKDDQPYLLIFKCSPLTFWMEKPYYFHFDMKLLVFILALSNCSALSFPGIQRIARDDCTVVLIANEENEVILKQQSR